MKESEIQKDIRKYLREKGILCERIQSGTIRVGNGFMHLASSGHPDLVCYLRGGKTMFLEIKGPKGKANEDQLAYHKRLARLGFEVAILNNLEDAKSLFQTLGYE